MIVGFTGGVEFFEVRLNDDGSNPKCIKSLDKVCLALTYPALSAANVCLTQVSITNDY